jgi:hypothetical protein
VLSCRTPWSSARVSEGASRAEAVRHLALVRAVYDMYFGRPRSKRLIICWGIVIWLGSKAIAFAEGSVRMISLEELVEAHGIGIAMPKGSTQWDSSKLLGCGKRLSVKTKYRYNTESSASSA